MSNPTEQPTYDDPSEDPEFVQEVAAVLVRDHLASAIQIALAERRQRRRERMRVVGRQDFELF